MADFSLHGYALSRTQRDSTKLPFRDVSLSEVRSDPVCTCLVVQWNAAGQHCQPCLEADAVLAGAVANDPTLCAIEVINFSYETFTFGKPLQPPTRADLDAFVQSGREPFPVGLVTDSAIAALTGSFPGVPNMFVVRPGDMRIVGFIAGRADALAAKARAFCTTPHPPVETFATNLWPRSFEVGGDGVFVSDARGLVLRLPLQTGGAPVELAKLSSVPNALALDDTNVFWATDEGPSFEIGTTKRDGSAPATPLATAASAFTGIARDGDAVYFTRADGTVGGVPASGGPVAKIFEGEPSPRDVVAADGVLAWIDDGTREVVRAAVDGTGREVVFSSSTEQPTGLAIRRENGEGPTLFVNTGTIIYIVRPGAAPAVLTKATGLRTFAIDPVEPILITVTIDDKTGAGAISTARTAEDTDGMNVPQTITTGQFGVRAIRGDGTTFLYWSTPDSIRRMPP